jgi:hypothetical protein
VINSNKEAISKLQGNSSTSIKNKSNLGKKLATIGLVALLSANIVTPALAHTNNYNDYYAGHNHYDGCGHYYSYVAYNKNWGIKDSTYAVTVSANRNNVGVVKKTAASSELLTAINNCLGTKKVNDSVYQYITFNIVYVKENDSYEIDINSFDFYKRNISNLGNLSNKSVFLPCKVFMSPEGQQWVDEANYIEYVKDKIIMYECSDGTLVNSYNSFKNWERELAKNPNNPTIPTNQNVALSQIVHYELDSDGTIWKDMAILEEYIAWKYDNNHNFKDGVYTGVNGTAKSFKEYAKKFNTPYFINSGLKKTEQYYGLNDFLFATEEQANKSFEIGYQKVK